MVVKKNLFLKKITLLIISSLLSIGLVSGLVYFFIYNEKDEEAAILSNVVNKFVKKENYREDVEMLISIESSEYTSGETGRASMFTRFESDDVFNTLVSVYDEGDLEGSFNYFSNKSDKYFRIVDDGGGVSSYDTDKYKEWILVDEYLLDNFDEIEEYLGIPELKILLKKINTLDESFLDNEIVDGEIYSFKISDKNESLIVEAAFADIEVFLQDINVKNIDFYLENENGKISSVKFEFDMNMYDQVLKMSLDYKISEYDNVDLEKEKKEVEEIVSREEDYRKNILTEDEFIDAYSFGDLNSKNRVKVLFQPLCDTDKCQEFVENTLVKLYEEAAYGDLFLQIIPTNLINEDQEYSPYFYMHYKGQNTLVGYSCALEQGAGYEYATNFYKQGDYNNLPTNSQYDSFSDDVMSFLKHDLGLDLSRFKYCFDNRTYEGYIKSAFGVKLPMTEGEDTKYGIVRVVIDGGEKNLIYPTYDEVQTFFEK